MGRPKDQTKKFQSRVLLRQKKSSRFLAISVYHDQQSYEISLAIEDARGSDAYSFSEILRLVNSEGMEQYRDYATHTVEGVAQGVRQLAALFRKCVDAGILNDSELFSRLKLRRGEWAKNYALETQLEQARKKSESAWAEKDFEKVVQILAPLQEHLNPSDLKKLEYAKKHSNASTSIKENSGSVFKILQMTRGSAWGQSVHRCRICLDLIWAKI